MTRYYHPDEFRALKDEALALGLPAAYVSGYILTSPPPGQPRLVGAGEPGPHHAPLQFGRNDQRVIPRMGVQTGGARDLTRGRERPGA